MTDHHHKWGPPAVSRFAGTVYVACACGDVSLDVEDDANIETGLCTCCEPPRPVHRQATVQDDRTAGSSGEEWEHDDDAMFATVFHVHAYSGGTDCDGPMERSHTYQLTSLVWERIFAADPGRTPDDSDLWAHLVRSEIPVHAESATITISEGHMDWSERTDEGHRGGSLDACTDPSCAHDGSSQRDHYAEAMGY